ncbi:extracellular solute-binding protein family 1 [Caldicellulosiruptor obsidiansis OB47]|uniref:Extracellular solute-binding protein family 1 n=1 Tax=Caldicellulosiruptor obsidiansis (strain ATCC BAA-2073 / JCM 16842 / OB47) TaxID=608506 RepID=D9TFX8_CALOO|nr:ABC transporter substrate-binding protein [Caldicellulosiruptor obsidiansis]ADL43098.1 extracellular solute-binding protein family 1 [Caldicellulosiruptor obsidiansis OB47]
MKVSKKFFVVVSMLVIVSFILSNCFISNAGSSKLIKPLKPTSEAKNPITLTMYSAETNPNDDGFKSPVAQKIKELTGVTLKIEYAISAGAGQQKLQLMAASGDYPDLVYAKGDLQLLKNAGGVVQLDSLIEKYGPNIKKAYGKNLKRLRWSPQDPHIYCLGITTDNDATLDVNGGFMVQHRVVIEQNYPRIRTIKDFEDAIVKYWKKHPTTEGLPTIPLTLSADDWRTVISVTNPAFQATGAPDDGEFYVDPKTLKVIRHYKRPIEKEYFRWLNHLWNAGILDRETFVQKDDQYKAKIASGRVLALIDAGWAVGEPITALKKAGKYEYTYGYYPVTVNEKIKQCPPDVKVGYTGGWGVAITVKCKDKVRAIKFLDWMCTEDANILRQWGIEGVHHTYVNGKRVFISKIDQMRKTDPTFSKKTGIGAYVYPFPRLPNTYIDSTGNPITPDTRKEDIRKNYSDVEKKVLSAYKAEIWKDLFPKTNEYPEKTWGYLWMIAIDDPNIKTINDKIWNYTLSTIPKVVMAKEKDFDKVWNDFLAGFERLGNSKVEEYYTKRIKQNIELWTK